MDRPPKGLAHRRWLSKRPNPAPRVLLVLLLFALPMVLIPSILDALNSPAPAPPPDPRDEVSRALAQDGVVLGAVSTPTGEGAPVEVAGQSVTKRAFDAPTREVAEEDGLVP